MAWSISESDSSTSSSSMLVESSSNTWRSSDCLSQAALNRSMSSADAAPVFTDFSRRTYILARSNSRSRTLEMMFMASVDFPHPGLPPISTTMLRGIPNPRLELTM